MALALLTPASQTLEAIEDFVRPVGLGRYAQGQRSQRSSHVRARSPEGRERSGQTIDGDFEDA